MKVHGQPMRTIWVEPDGWSVGIIDQTRLPHAFVTARLTTMDGWRTPSAPCSCAALRSSAPRRPTACASPCARTPSDGGLEQACATLAATRPTAINLRWALEEMRRALQPLARLRACRRRVPARRGAVRRGRRHQPRASAARAAAVRGGLGAQGPKGRLNVLTHCNAGWLATVDWGTALAPIYLAHDAGIPVHVWVDETRPRNQGASLTAWELGQHGVPHTVIADNVGGHLMQHGHVDLCIVGTDRTTAPRRRRQQDRHLSQGARGARTTACRSMWRCPRPPSTGRSRTACATSPSSSATARELTDISGRLPTGEVVTVRITPPGSSAATTAST